ncbi:MAG: LON peptidase substrate-binding domain-containing protein [Gammaproteobacteria bacterium]
MSTTLPLFPLQTVVFPGGRLPLRVFEQRYIDMVKQAIADNTPFGICAIREGQEVGAPAVPCEVGTLVHIADWDMPEAGILHIDTRARERFIVRSTRTEPSGLIVGTVDAISAEPATAIPEDLMLTVQILRHIVGEFGADRFPAPLAFDDAAWVGFRLSEVLPLKLSTKQNLLEMNDSVTRLRILAEFLKQHVN